MMCDKPKMIILFIFLIFAISCGAQNPTDFLVANDMTPDDIILNDIQETEESIPTDFSYSDETITPTEDSLTGGENSIDGDADHEQNSGDRGVLIGNPIGEPEYWDDECMPVDEDDDETIQDCGDSNSSDTEEFDEENEFGLPQPQKNQFLSIERVINPNPSGLSNSHQG